MSRRLLGGSFTNFPKSLSAGLLVIRLSSSNLWRHWNCYFSAFSEDWAVFLNGTEERNLYKYLSSSLFTVFSFSSLRIARKIIQSLTRWRENLSLFFPVSYLDPAPRGSTPTLKRQGCSSFVLGLLRKKQFMCLFNLKRRTALAFAIPFRVR